MRSWKTEPSRLSVRASTRVSGEKPVVGQAIKPTAWSARPLWKRVPGPAGGGGGRSGRRGGGGAPGRGAEAAGRPGDKANGLVGAPLVEEGDGLGRWRREAQGSNRTAGGRRRGEGAGGRGGRGAGGRR